MKTPHEKLAKAIERQCKVKGITKAELARCVGRSRGGLWRWLKNNVFDESCVKKLCDTVGLSVSSVADAHRKFGDLYT
jgi:transcriptional regulator with XRE-family HTH domain